ncbi:lysine--tRNA ligase [Candidatus Woesearchaeota archaeon]|nr:lysine--tRNA ligase [Candidatus Woesearchaeota archaeon]
MAEENLHWADQTAEQIIKRNPDKKDYVVATGATPSGTLHIGNFREFIMGDFITRALKHKEKKATHYHYWDDYDVFRKVPKNMPKQDILEKNLRKAIVDIPDVIDGKHENYAVHHEKEFEELLPVVGLSPTIIRNSVEYKKCVMAEEMKIALENTDKIKDILNKYRREELEKSWLPISIYCEKCGLEAEKISYEGDYNVLYECRCGDKQTFDFRKKGLAKFKYRIQVPAFWHYKKVDFESAGKDHYAAGGVFSLAPLIAKEVYKIDKALGYGFGWIGVKGGGQFSSSLGNIITLKDVLDIYEPDIVRWLFAGSRPGTEFSISFDLDVVKIYEDFDKVERIYFKEQKVGEKEYGKQKRIYELSCVGEPPKKLPFQPSFRHLTNILMVNDMDTEKSIGYYEKQLKDEFDKERLRKRAECAKNWIEKYAPEDFKFKINKKLPKIELSDKEKEIVKKIGEALGKKDWEDKELHEEFYVIAESLGVEPAELFKAAYKILISKEKGPKLASFILTIGKDKVKKLFEEV